MVMRLPIVIIIIIIIIKNEIGFDDSGYMVLRENMRRETNSIGSWV